MRPSRDTRSVTLRAVLGASLVALAVTGTARCAQEPVPTAAVDGAWERLPDSPLGARRGATAAWVADRFVVVGGWSDAGCFDTGDCALDLSAALADGASFDPETGRWRTIAAAPVPVPIATTAVVGDTLYALVPDLGPDPGPATMLAYDADGDTWTTLAPPPAQTALVAAGDTVLAVAGSDEYGPTTDAVLDPATGTWDPLPDDPLGPSFDRQAVWLGDRLLLAAKELTPSPGATDPAVLRVTELSADLRTWSAPRETDVTGWGLVAVAGRVVVPEYGSSDGGEVNTWDRAYPNGGVLDVASRTWSELPEARLGPAWDRLPSVVLGDRVVVGGGLLDPVAGTWLALPELPTDAAELAVAAGAGTLFVWGGASRDDGTSDEGYLLTPGA